LNDKIKKTISIKNAKEITTTTKRIGIKFKKKT